MEDSLALSVVSDGILMEGLPRSSRWPQCRHDFLKSYPKCKACGTMKLLNVHHKLPYHLFPEHELDQKNLITLCETPTHNCHFILGHLMDWTQYNPDVEELVAFFAKCLANRRGQ